MSYTPSYKGFFNKTMPLFAPRTYRADDYNDPVHLERISTLNMFVTKDLGAIPDGEIDNFFTNSTTERGCLSVATSQGFVMLFNMSCEGLSGQ